ncbi:MAG: AMP-binding protein, partial [Burkholderiaceae bacterium]
MDHPWFEHYPDGVPRTISLGAYTSLVSLINEGFRQYASRPAYVGLGKQTTFAEIDSTSKIVSAWLMAKGLKKGDRVALMMPNIVQYPIILAGVLRAGLVVVNVNPLYTPRELEHQLTDSGAKAIFILENFAATLEEVRSRTALEHIVVASMGDPLGFVKGAIVNFVVRKVKKLVPAFDLPGSERYSTVVAEGASMPFNPPEVGLDDLAFLQYTGGTTGVSKGAALLHRNILANVLQSEAWSQPAMNNPARGPAPEQAV